MGRRVGPEGYAAQTTEFHKSLGKALDKFQYVNLAEPIMEDLAIVAMEAAHDSIKVHAPVGNPAKPPIGDSDPHPGLLRDSVYKYIEKKDSSISAIIGIPYHKVPYIWRVIVGGRNRQPNGFMQIAKQDAFDAVKKTFRKVTQEQFNRLNRG